MTAAKGCGTGSARCEVWLAHGTTLAEEVCALTLAIAVVAVPNAVGPPDTYSPSDAG